MGMADGKVRYRLKMDYSSIGVNLKAGSIGVLKSGGKVWFDGNSAFFFHFTVRFHSEWFEEIDEYGNPVPPGYSVAVVDLPTVERSATEASFTLDEISECFEEHMILSQSPTLNYQELKQYLLSIKKP